MPKHCRGASLVLAPRRRRIARFRHGWISAFFLGTCYWLLGTYLEKLAASMLTAREIQNHKERNWLLVGRLDNRSSEVLVPMFFLKKTFFLFTRNFLFYFFFSFEMKEPSINRTIRGPFFVISVRPKLDIHHQSSIRSLKLSSSTRSSLHVLDFIMRSWTVHRSCIN